MVSPLFLLLFFLLAPRPPSLQQDTEQYEADADVERKINLAPLTEDEEGEDDGVAGLEVVREIDGEGRQALQGLNLQEIHTNGAEQRVAEHEPEIRALGHNDDRLLAGKEKEIDGDDGRYQHEPSRHLVHQHRPTAHTHARFLVADGIEGTDGRRDNTNGNTIAVAGIKREDAQHTCDGNQRKQQFEPGESSLEDKRLKESREEAYQRETNDTDRDIRGLNATIEQNPVESQQCSTATKLQELAPPYSRQTREHQQNHARKQHPIPHDVHLVKRNEPSEQARKACQKHTQVQLHKSFSCLVHLLVLLYPDEFVCKTTIFF